MGNKFHIHLLKFENRLIYYFLIYFCFRLNLTFFFISVSLKASPRKPAELFRNYIGREVLTELTIKGHILWGNNAV
jgi:hypothetical protein